MALHRDPVLERIVYGDKVLYGSPSWADWTVAANMKSAIVNRGFFLVNNANCRGDPNPGAVKRLTVDWRETPQGPILRTSASENQHIRFDAFVLTIKYGGKTVKDPAAYERFNVALCESSEAHQKQKTSFLGVFGDKDAGRIRIENDIFGMPDPNPGSLKTCEVYIVDNSEVGAYWHKYEEHDLFPRGEALAPMHFTDIPTIGG